MICNGRMRLRYEVQQYSPPIAIWNDYIRLVLRGWAGRLRLRYETQHYLTRKDLLGFVRLGVVHGATILAAQMQPTMKEDVGPCWVSQVYFFCKEQQSWWLNRNLQHYSSTTSINSSIVISNTLASLMTAVISAVAIPSERA